MLNAVGGVGNIQHGVLSGSRRQSQFPVCMLANGPAFQVGRAAERQEPLLGSNPVATKTERVSTAAADYTIGFLFRPEALVDTEPHTQARLEVQHVLDRFDPYRRFHEINIELIVPGRQDLHRLGHGPRLVGINPNLPLRSDRLPHR